MQRHHAITKLFLAFGVLWLAVSLTPFCLAQTQAPQSRLYWVTVTQVKPGMGEQYQAFIKNETLPAFKKTGGKELGTWTVQNFGPGGEYWVIRPVENFKQLDETNFLTKALGGNGRAYLSGKTGATDYQFA